METNHTDFLPESAASTWRKHAGPYCPGERFDEDGEAIPARCCECNARLEHDVYLRDGRAWCVDCAGWDLACECAGDQIDEHGSEHMRAIAVLGGLVAS